MAGGDLEAEAKIILDSSSLEASSVQIQKEFKKMDATSDKALSNVDKSLEDTGTEAKKTGDKIKQGADKGYQAFDKLGDAAEETSRDTAALGIEIIGLAQGFGGISDAIFGANEQLVKIQRSTFGVETTIKDLRIEVEDFAIALAAGELSGLGANRALEALSFTYKDLKIQQLESKTEQESLNSQFINMGLSIGQTAALSVLTLQTALKGMTVDLLRSKITAFATGNTMKMLGFNFQGAALAMKGATFSLVGFRAGIRATMLALGPIGIAMIGIGAAMAIWETNAFGIQEKMSDLWELLKDMFPILELIATTIQSIFPTAAEGVDEFGTSIEFAGLSTDELLKKLQDGEITMDEFAASVRAGNHELGEMSNLLETGVSSGLSDTTSETMKGSEAFALYAANVKRASTELEFLKKKQPISILTNASLEAAGKLSDAVTSKGIIDQAMMNALVAAEAAGLIAAGTAGQYATSTGYNKAGTQRAVNIANAIGQFDEFGRIGKFATTSVSSRSVAGSKGLSLINAARSAGFNLGSAGGGSRNTKSEKDARIKTGFSNDDFKLAQTLGLISKTGIHKRHQAFRRISLGQSRGAAARELLETAQIKIPTINLRSTSRKGNAGIVAAHNAREQAAFAEKIKTILQEAKDKLKQKGMSESAINAFISGASDDFASAQSAESFLSDTFGVSTQTSSDISNRINFIQRTQKEMLISTTV